MAGDAREQAARAREAAGEYAEVRRGREHSFVPAYNLCGGSAWPALPLRLQRMQHQSRALARALTHCHTCTAPTPSPCPLLLYAGGQGAGCRGCGGCQAVRTRGGREGGVSLPAGRRGGVVRHRQGNV